MKSLFDVTATAVHRQEKTKPDTMLQFDRREADGAGTNETWAQVHVTHPVVSFCYHSKQLEVNYTF